MSDTTITAREAVEMNITQKIKARQCTVHRPEFSGSWVESIEARDGHYRMIWYMPFENGCNVTDEAQDELLEVCWLSAPVQPKTPPLPEGVMKAIAIYLIIILALVIASMWNINRGADILDTSITFTLLMILSSQSRRFANWIDNHFWN